MAQVDIPMALGAAFWEKQKTALAKATKAPPTKLGDELKTLTRLHTGVGWEGKDFSADSVKALLAQLQTVVAALTKFETEAKKDKGFPKEPLIAVTAIDKAAKEYRTDVDSSSPRASLPRRTRRGPPPRRRAAPLRRQGVRWAQQAHRHRSAGEAGAPG
jgi:hypothetical protein